MFSIFQVLTLLSLDHDLENTSERDYLKLMMLHGRIFILFYQFVFSILTHFQSAHDINIFFN